MSEQTATRPWTDYAADELEQHYNPRASVANIESYDEARAVRNAAALASSLRTADIRYGPGHLEDLDIYAPAAGEAPYPVHVFIHGGYWRAREKENFGYIGEALANQGFLTVVINYPLCPVVDLDQVVESNRKALEWVVRNIADHGGDPERLTLSGHSAGGHLGAAIIATDWAARGLRGQPLQGAVLVSGIFDPAPAQHLSIRAEIGITPELAERHNYAKQPPRLDCPVHVVVGGGEPQGWIDQSADYATHMRNAGRETRLIVTGRENHFSIMEQFCEPSADVLASILVVSGR
ncbi:MAG: alpha/beta hydrolase [Alphaproteobacteria bacterium]|nr:alpha/beta hydrolase [Alphaproteobacteria bacterium]